MTHTLKNLLYCFVLLLPLSAYSKLDGDSLRSYSLALTGDTLLLDSLSIVPESFLINGEKPDTADFYLDYAAARLIWKGKGEKPSSIAVSYQCFPFNFSTPYFRKDPALISPAMRGSQNPFYYTYTEEPEDGFSFKTLDKRGSISRGVNFGNSQNLSVNSNLNLQLAGKITDRIHVLAAITDENIPIQPDGNTQQLQDFDQVYIQLYDENTKLTAGDFQLQRPNSYFMQYYKRAQGANVQTSFRLNPEDSTSGINKLEASAAVSRGKFARNVFFGLEGNQGPYRLRGAENEQFIIVLSGTESVFIDGKLLTRGQENDYVINYNTAEIIFTAKQLITKDKRIVVEFQYSDQNYARSLFQLSNEYKKDNVNLRFNFYSEQDSKNQPLQQDLTDEQKELMRNVGDNLDEAISKRIDSVAFSGSLVLYKMIDTLINGTLYDSVFIYSTNPDEAFYRLSFSNVGLGNGNYIPKNSTANGRVFEWVAPDALSGARRGTHEPVILLITPKKRQMITLGGDYVLKQNTKMSMELALSNNDINTFSDLDADDNIGYGVKLNIENKKHLAGEQNKAWILTSLVGFEQWEKNFTEVERIRSVEFDRDWNLRGLQLTDNQNIANGGLRITRLGKGFLHYNLSSFTSGTDYTALKNELTTDIKTHGFDINFNGSYIETNGKLIKSQFQRHKSLVRKSFKHFTLGYRDDFEDNKIIDPLGDTLSRTAYKFWEWEVFATNADSAQNMYRLGYTQRKDYGAANDMVGLATFGESISFDFDLKKNQNSRLSGKSTYRTLRIENNELTNLQPDNTFLNRLEYQLRLLKGAVTSSSFYEVGSGLEVKREFTYIEVAPGQGAFSWTDYNGNGVKELDEFEVARFPDQANFIRVFTPTDDYVKTYTNQFNQLIHLNPGTAWRNKEGYKKFLAKFSNQAAFRIDRKTNNEQLENRFNPFTTGISDSDLVSLNSSFRNTFYFNRTHQKFGADINYQDIRNKVLLTNGFETRVNTYVSPSFRWNITKKWVLNNSFTEGEKSNLSDFFSMRNYVIAYRGVEPSISFQPGPKFRLSLIFEYEEKINKEEFGGEKTYSQRYGTDIKYNDVGKGSLMLSANYIVFRYNGSANTPLAFEMLDGLQAGQNGTWTIAYQRTLANNLQLSINYNGRASENANVIHAGGVQVRAFF